MGILGVLPKMTPDNQVRIPYNLNLYYALHTKIYTKNFPKLNIPTKKKNFSNFIIHNMYIVYSATDVLLLFINLCLITTNMPCNFSVPDNIIVF